MDQTKNVLRLLGNFHLTFLQAELTLYTLLIAIGSFLGFIVAYNTYGRWIATRVFNLDPNAKVPSCEYEDGVDFVPSKKSLVFGHHFTSIAGTGPIVGPAIAVFWGWLPALLWVVFGSIFIGAVHDFGSLVVSLRNRGQTVGEIAGRMISPRAKLLFLFALFFALTVVLAIFGLVIAVIFQKYPESVLAVWISLPIAIVFGLAIRRQSQAMLPMSIISLILIYLAIYVGAYFLPISFDFANGWNSEFGNFVASNQIVVWTVILLIYCGIASVLPVWLLLQPRDYVNSHQLFLALTLLTVGLVVACLWGNADLFTSAPAITQDTPEGTPPIFPFLFITIACGAISGFHCLVSSGTSSKQLENESDAKVIGYGAMLLEAALAVMVILACCAGVGMGKYESTEVTQADGRVRMVDKPVLDVQGNALVGRAAWRQTYQLEYLDTQSGEMKQKSWKDFKLANKIGAFVEGGGNFLSAIGIPLKMGISIIAVLVASFAATTLDSATRLQRYVIQELGGTLRIKPLTNKYAATLVAIGLGGAIAMIPNADGQYGKGGMLLWPLFGATNQLLAGFAFLVTAFYLWRRSKPVGFVLIPTVIMIALPAAALLWQLFDPTSGWMAFGAGQNWLAGSIGLVTIALQIWMVIEAVIAWPKVKGVLEPQLSDDEVVSTKLKDSGGRAC